MSGIMYGFIGDFVHVVRGLRRRMGLIALAVVTLALGIGLTSAMFGVTHGLLLNGLPFEDGHRIVAIIRNAPTLQTFLQTVSIREYAEWEERQTTFENIAAFTNATFNVSGDGPPERHLGAAMTPRAFRILRTNPTLGRAFTADDAVPGAPRVVVIGHILWRDRFESDPDVLGKTMRLDGFESTIIGVMEDGFEFPAAHRLWIPLEVNPLQAAQGEGQFRVFGRLAEGVAVGEAQAEFAGIAAQLAVEYPETNEDITISIRPYVEQFVGPQALPMLLIMLGAVSFVLLIACTNVANLLLARAVLRSREVAIRTALGARRSRLIISHMMEAFILVVLGGVGGFGVAQLGISLFYRGLTANVKPFWLEARVEPEVLLFVAFLMLISTLVSGALPALRATKTDVADVLKDEARGSSGLKLGRLSRLLVTAEIAASCALLVGTGIMIKSVANFSRFEYSFTTENIFTAAITAGDGDFPDEAARVRFLEDLETRVAAIPNVVAAGIATEPPIIGVAQLPVEVDGKTYDSEQDRPLARVVATTPGMFETFQVPQLQGRAFAATDGESSLPIALVNQSFVTREFAGESPLGKRLRLQPLSGPTEWLTVVGVVGDMYLEERLSLAPPAAVYVPMQQREAVAGALGFFQMTLVARTLGDPMAITSQVRDALAGLNADIPLSQESSFSQTLAQTYVGILVIGSTFAVFGLVALFLAAVGLYGVMSFSANQRTKELGIRMAFGARTRDAFTLVLREAGKQLLIGLAVGLPAGLGLSYALQFAVFEVDPFQPGIMLLVVLVLDLAVFAAAVIPAVRASKVDPVVAIRYE